MRVLIDVTHPADVYIFLHTIRRLEAQGHEVRLTGRDKDMLLRIAAELGLSLETFGQARPGARAMAMEMALRMRRLFGIVRRFRPHVGLSVAGPYLAPVCRLLGVPCHVWYDTEHAAISNRIAYPCATCVHVPVSYRDQLRCRHERYAGYQELAYLHPDHFKPDPEVLGELGVAPTEPFVIARFVSWQAAHDFGLSGFTLENKIRAVRAMQRYARVFITSEQPLPEAIADCRLRLPVTRIHHAIHHASLVFGESATMASEAACLGVPSIFVDAVGRGYTDEQETVYRLVHNFRPEAQDQAIERAVAILAQRDRDLWRQRGARLISEKINVADLIHQTAIAYAPGT